MSKTISSLLLGVAAGILTALLVPFIVSDVDQAWWISTAAAGPGATPTITGREFISSAIGMGAWWASLANAVRQFERAERERG